MNRLYLILSAIIFLGVLSCTQKSEEKKTDRKIPTESVKETPEQNVRTPEQPANAENFYAFLEKFNKEENFQLKRIIFPITVTIPDTEHQGMAPTQESVTKYEWEPLDLTYDSTYVTRDYDKYYQTINFRNDTAVVELRGINNGIYADYYFKLIDNEWFLVTLNEASF